MKGNQVNSDAGHGLALAGAQNVALLTVERQPFFVGDARGDGD
jgi:hypothetical protein